jgi:hypothetical protein
MGGAWMAFPSTRAPMRRRLGDRVGEVVISLAHLAGVAAIFPGTPAVCGRADCLGWARALVHRRRARAPARPPASRTQNPPGGSASVPRYWACSQQECEHYW